MQILNVYILEIGCFLKTTNALYRNGAIAKPLDLVSLIKIPEKLNTVGNSLYRNITIINSNIQL